MSEFVNYNKRDVALPAGCKNLADLLNRQRSGRLSQSFFTEEQFSTEGLAQIGRFVRMMLDSGAEFCVVKISGIELPMDVSILRRPKEGHFSILTSPKDPQQVNAIRSLFERERLAPLFVSKASPHALAYSLPVDAARATSIITELLCTTEGLTDQSGLNFYFMGGNDTNP